MAKQKLKNPGKRNPAAADTSDSPAAKPSVKATAESSPKQRSAKNGGDKNGGDKNGGDKSAVAKRTAVKGRATKSGTIKGKSKAKLAHKGGGRIADTSRPVPDPGIKPAPTKLVHKILRRPKSLGRLERLELAVDEVRRGSRTSPRTRKLQTAGVPKMAQKVIEEAGEVALEATIGNRTALINESVDLLYNLVVLLGACDVSVDALWNEMDRREATLGMAEKLPKTFDPDA